VLSGELGVHFVNQLFERRQLLELRPPERILLLRTYLHHAGGDMSRMRLVSCVAAGSANRACLRARAVDSDVVVRTSALAVLREIRNAPSPQELAQWIAPMLRADEVQVRWAAIEFLAARAEAATLRLLEEEQLAQGQPSETQSTRVRILSAFDPD
jgi:hypothetical protein